MSNDDSRIEQLKKKLFSNSGEELPATKRARLQRHSVLVDNDWKDEDDAENPVIRPQEDEDRMPMFKKILYASLVFFGLALAFAGYTVYTGSNSVSNSNIDIRLLGPVSSPAGEELSLDIDIENKNKSDLILSDLVITYPDGTRRADDRATALNNERISIGTIKQGQTSRQTIKAILFGEENAKKAINISLEYRLEGSSNIFVKEKQYSIFIGTSPVTVTVDALKEVIPEQETDFVVKVNSNSTSVVKGLVLKAEYPFGFEFISASPNTSGGDNGTWVLGDIQPGEERVITLRGRLLGGDNQERVIKFYTGTEDPSDKNEIGTIFVTNTTALTLRKPFLSADLTLDGKSLSAYTAGGGQDIKGEITWQNNLNIPVNDAIIEVRLSGQMLDKLSIDGERGFYRSIDNTIVWDKTNQIALTEIGPKETGRVQFTFATLQPTRQNNSTFRRPSINVDITVKAKRLNESRVAEEIVSTISRPVKIESHIALASSIVRNAGPFENTGPIPPMPEQRSTYTILVSLSNSYNNVKDAVYTAVLPPYVEWLGETYPNNTGVSYNRDTRTVSWTIGDIAPGTGYSSSAKEFAYQVAFLPSVSQLGRSPNIINSQRISGKDNFTGTIIQTNGEALTTEIRNDPKYQFGQEKVGGQ